MANNTPTSSKKLHKLFETELKKAGIKVMKNNLTRHEFHLRAELGDAAKNILSGIVPCELKKSDVSLTQKYGTENIVTTKAFSGIPKGTELLLVNNGKSNNGVLKTKQLTPVALGFAGNTYKEKQLYDALIKSLDSVDASVRHSVLDLIEGSYKNKPSINTEGVSKADINIIAKDYGEMTGALWAMKHYYKEAVSVTFSAASNAALVDYYFSTKDGGMINVSAKAGAGSAPSLTAVSGLINEGLIKPAAKYKKAAKFITDVKDLSGMDAIVEFSKRYKTPGYQAIVKAGGKIKTHTEFEKQISAMSYDEVKTQFSSVWEVMNRFPNEANAEKLFKTSGKKAGVILSPLGYHMIDEINNIKDHVDFLNDSLNSLNTQQLYLDISAKTFKYTVKEFKEATFKYHFDSNIKNPANKKISFKMKK